MLRIASYYYHIMWHTVRQTLTSSMTTKDSSRGTRLPPSRVENVHFRGLTNSRPTPQDSQPQSTLAANSDSLITFPHLAEVKT